MLLCAFSGVEYCVEMKRFRPMKEKNLRFFVSLKHRIPNHEAFFGLFIALYAADLRIVLKGLPSGRGGNLGEVSAVDGNAKRSLPQLVHAFASESKMVPCRDLARGNSNEVTSTPALLDLIAAFRRPARCMRGGQRRRRSPAAEASACWR